MSNTRTGVSDDSMYGTASGSADMQRTANHVERLGARLNDPQRRRAVLRLFNVKAFGFVEQHLGGFGDVRNEDAPRSRM